jgi:uncharacterized membrane protein YgaE (UPF0421/DUF939 family)
MTFFTNHDYSWHNINVIFVNPLLLAAVPLGLIAAFSRKDTRRILCGKLLKGLWTYVFAGAVLTVIIGLLPGHYAQQNLTTVVFIAPVALILSFIPELIKVGRR